MTLFVESFYIAGAERAAAVALGEVTSSTLRPGWGSVAVPLVVRVAVRVAHPDLDAPGDRANQQQQPAKSAESKACNSDDRPRLGISGGRSGRKDEGQEAATNRSSDDADQHWLPPTTHAAGTYRRSNPAAASFRAGRRRTPQDGGAGAAGVIATQRLRTLSASPRPSSRTCGPLVSTDTGTGRTLLAQAFALTPHDLPDHGARAPVSR